MNPLGLVMAAIMGAAFVVIGAIAWGTAYQEGFSAAKAEDEQIRRHVNADMDKLGLCEWPKAFSKLYNCKAPQ